MCEHDKIANIKICKLLNIKYQVINLLICLQIYSMCEQCGGKNIQVQVCLNAKSVITCTCMGCLQEYLDHMHISYIDVKHDLTLPV